MCISTLSLPGPHSLPKTYASFPAKVPKQVALSQLGHHFWPPFPLRNIQALGRREDMLPFWIPLCHVRALV